MRKPLYTTSVRRWERYAQHLGPLRQRLAHWIEAYEQLLTETEASRRGAGSTDGDATEQGHSSSSGSGSSSRSSSSSSRSSSSSSSMAENSVPSAISDGYEAGQLSPPDLKDEL